MHYLTKYCFNNVQNDIYLVKIFQQAQVGCTTPRDSSWVVVCSFLSLTIVTPPFIYS